MKKKIYGSLLGITIFLLSIGIYISIGYKLNQFVPKPYVPSHWTLETLETGSIKPISLPYSFKFDGNYHYALTTKIDYQQEGLDSPYLFITMNHSYFRVLIDNQEIYSYTKETTPSLSKSPGNIYTAVALPHDYAGKELRLEFTLTLEKGLTYVLSDLFLSDYPSAIHSMFVNDLFHNSIILSILLIGIILITISIFTSKESSNMDGFFIGLFAFLVGLYGLTESMFNLFMLANPYLSYLINFIIFAAIPAPILAFYSNKVAPSFRVFYSAGLILTSLNIVGQILLHFTKILDIRQTLICTHVLYLASFLLITFSSIKSSREECTDKKLLISLIIPIIIGGIVDALMHYVFLGFSQKNTAYSQLGVLITLLIASGYLTKNMMATYREHLNAQNYKQLAFKDGLTDIYNRMAYNEEVQLLSKNPADNQNLICVCVDINDLKKVNDSLGHLMGDRMIQQTAYLLNTTFCKYGKVFRIGGDEFIALLYNLKEDTLIELLRVMYNEVKQYNNTHTPTISFSVGYELLKNVKNRDIKECFRRADMKMYAEKEAFKKMNEVVHK